MPQNMLQARGKVTAVRENCINYHHAAKSEKFQESSLMGVGLTSDLRVPLIF